MLVFNWPDNYLNIVCVYSEYPRYSSNTPESHVKPDALWSMFVFGQNQVVIGCYLLVKCIISQWSDLIYWI